MDVAGSLSSLASALGFAGRRHLSPVVDVFSLLRSFDWSDDSTFEAFRTLGSLRPDGSARNEGKV